MPPDKTIDTVLAVLSIGILILGLGSLALGWLLGQWDRAVNHFRDRAPAVMSRSVESAAPSVPSSLQTDNQTDRQTAALPPLGPAELLTLYALMREYGVPRERARVALKGVRLPLDNNLWTKASPPEPEVVTPIAGRPTRASFPDAELEYQPPPR